MRALLKTQPTATVRGVLLAGMALIVLGACQKSTDPGASQEMTWAKSALERNPNVEIIAADAQAGVFTIRDRRTGEVQAVMLGELAAAPIAQLTAPAPTTAGEALEETVAEVDASAVNTTVSAEPAPPDEPVAAIEPTDASAPAAETKAYTIERVDGQVKVSGPGLSIVSGGSAPPVSAKDAPGQRTVDPIICEGRRMMHFDDRDIYVEGDAITVRGGCELFITNSRIVAAGTGVIVRDGIVHIANSYVEGASASFDAAAEARLYLRGSTFQGVSRRDSRAMIQDQGGNQLR
jgi:hypothetical protein